MPLKEVDLQILINNLLKGDQLSGKDHKKIFAALYRKRRKGNASFKEKIILSGYALYDEEKRLSYIQIALEKWRKEQNTN